MYQGECKCLQESSQTQNIVYVSVHVKIWFHTRKGSRLISLLFLYENFLVKIYIMIYEIILVKPFIQDFSG